MRNLRLRDSEVRLFAFISVSAAVRNPPTKPGDATFRPLENKKNKEDANSPSRPDLYSC